jgi:hypothetical protein
MDADEHDSDSGDDWREDSLEDARWEEGQNDGQQAANHAGTEESTPGFWAREVCDVSVGVDCTFAVARVIHVGNRALKDGQENKAGAYDGEQSGSQEVLSLSESEASDLDQREEA